MIKVKFSDNFLLKQIKHAKKILLYKKMNQIFEKQLEKNGYDEKCKNCIENIKTECSKTI